MYVSTDPHERQLHYPPPHVVGERPPVDEDSAQLVDPRLAWSRITLSVMIEDTTILEMISNV